MFSPSRLRALILVAFLALAPSAVSTPPSSSLRDYRWKNRIVHLVAPAADDPQYQAQAVALMAAFEGLLDRDIIVRCDLNAPTFEFTLIGKDGGKKLTRRDVVSAEELFAIIDAMPMRREEVRDQARPE
jgi:hypothetical protein